MKRYKILFANLNKTYRSKSQNKPRLYYYLIIIISSKSAAYTQI